MEIQDKKVEKNVLTAEIAVSVEELQPYLQKAAVQMSQAAKIEGFRPGKAPYEIVKQKFGEQSIYQEAVDEVVHHTVDQVLKNEGWRVYGQPKIEVTKVAVANPMEYKIEVALVPEVTIGDLENIKVDDQFKPVDETAVDKVLKDLQRHRSQEILVDRPAARGDMVHVSFEVFLDNVPIENGQHKKYPLVLGEGKMIPGFEDQIIGLKAAENKEFKLSFPKEYHAKNLAGKECDFKVALQAVYEIKEPELNDEFAKELKYDSLAALKEQLHKNLTAEAKQVEQQRQDQVLIEQLIEVSQFGDLPEKMVTDEAERLLEEMKNNLAKQGLDWDHYLEHLKKTDAELKLEMAPQAAKRAKSYLVFQQLAKDQGIEAATEEIDKELEQLKTVYAQQPEILKTLELPAYRRHLAEMIRSRKVLSFLREQLTK